MGGPDNRYRAFISYSQQDKDWGRRIHTWLETYRVPAGVGPGAQPERRLGRFFRDDEDMAARSERDQLWTLAADMLARADFTGMMSAVSLSRSALEGMGEAHAVSKATAAALKAI